MADKKGTGLLMVWADIPADKEEDFNNWYNTEHLAELLSLPGVLNAARYEAVSSGPKHLACYELENAAVVDQTSRQVGEVWLPVWLQEAPLVVSSCRDIVERGQQYILTRCFFLTDAPRATFGGKIAQNLPW